MKLWALALLCGMGGCRFDTSGLMPAGDARPAVPDRARSTDGGGEGAVVDLLAGGETRGDLGDSRPPDTSGPCANSPWTISVVAPSLGSNGGDTYDPSLALDSAGNPHVVYYDYTQQKVLYASLVSGGWVSETVASTGSPNWHWWSTLAIDAAGKPHLAYHKSGCNVMYATRSTTWKVETLEGSAATMSIGLDSTGKVHLAYSVTGGPPTASGDLKITSNLTGPWSQALKIGDGHYASLVVDDQNHRHLVWYETPKKKLRYASDASGSWVPESPDPATEVGEFPSLVRQPDGTILIAYYDRGKGDLKLATRTGTTWTVEVVETKDDVGLYPSLAISPDGVLNISFYDATSKDLRHTRSDTSKKGWTSEAVDTAGTVGRFPSLAIGPDRRAHLVYFDDSGHGVKYATHPCR